MRKAFNFYSSYFEIMNELDDKSIALFIKALTSVQFLKVHIDEIKFDDKILSIAWKSIKHSIQKQLEEYCDANGLKYSTMFSNKLAPTRDPYGIASEVPYGWASEGVNIGVVH